MWLSLAILKNMYFTKFESVLIYGTLFWGEWLKDIEIVFKVQKKNV
jgi:hypothetical protein